MSFLIDDLTDSNVELSLHTESGAGATGGGWQKVVGSTQDAKVDNGALHCDGVSSSAAYINLAVPLSADYFAESVFVHAGRIHRWLLRFSGTSYTGYAAEYDYTAEAWSIMRHDGSATWTKTGLSTPNTFSQAANPTVVRDVRVEISTPDAATVNIKLIVDGATLLDVNDTHANRITSAGHVGLSVYQKIDDANGIRSITADVLAAASATQLTLSGPASGTTGAASSNFTVTADAAVSSDVTITPATTGTGTFSPSSPTIASGATSTTFTYTPSSDEIANVSITNDGGLSVTGSPIAYTSSSADTTAPTLSSATGTKTGQTTATGSITTNEANGTLYAFCSTSATPPSSANLKTGTGAAYSTSVSVSSAGAKSFSATGLSAATTYYWHFLHRDAAGNDSTIATSAGFTTDAAAAGSITTSPFRNIETGALMASVTFSKVLLWNRNADTATVLSSQTSNASGQLSITGLIAGNDYAVIPADDVATVVSDTKSSVRHYRAA